MTKKNRTAVPAAVSRVTKVEAAHQCAVWRCRQVSHLEQHHIDGNPSNHDPDNLILLCRQHHAMADRGEITKLELVEYKRRLQQAALVTERPNIEEMERSEALVIPYARRQASISGAPSAKVLRVLIDQSHRQVEWRGFPTADDGYRDALDLLGEDCAVSIAVHGPLSSFVLERFEVLILPTSFGMMVENEEYEAIAKWVYAGNGLLVFGNYLMESHHYMNLNQLMHKFGMEFSHDLVMPLNRDDFRSCMGQAFGLHRDLIVVTEPAGIPAAHPVFSVVRKLAFQSSCTVLCSRNVAFSVSTSEQCSVMKAIGPKNEFGKILQIQDYVLDKRAPACFMVGLQHGAGRILAIGSWKIFLNEFIHNEPFDNRILFQNAISWLACNS